MRLAIVGSRDFPDRTVLDRYIAGLPSGTEIVSGGARGVDSWAIEAAKANGLPTKVFPADWNKYGKSAGFRRNAEIVEYADRVVAFWYGESRGTKHTIDLAQAAGKLEATVIYDAQQQSKGQDAN